MRKLLPPAAQNLRQQGRPDTLFLILVMHRRGEFGRFIRNLFSSDNTRYSETYKMQAQILCYGSIPENGVLSDGDRFSAEAGFTQQNKKPMVP
jgi:hypothetical protein